MPDPATIILKGKRSVVVTRRFDAPRAIIWAAFTDAGVLPTWLAGPAGWFMHRCEVDLRVGGGYRWGWRRPETEEEFGFCGTFTKVEEGQSFADDQYFDTAGEGAPISMRTQNHVHFRDCKTRFGAGTLMTSTVCYANAPTRFLVMEQGLGQGLELAYQRLDRALHVADDIAVLA